MKKDETTSEYEARKIRHHEQVNLMESTRVYFNKMGSNHYFINTYSVGQRYYSYELTYKYDARTITLLMNYVFILDNDLFNNITFNFVVTWFNGTDFHTKQFDTKEETTIKLNELMRLYKDKR